MHLFLYTVPKLEYKGEDIRIEVSLTVKRGNAELIMAGALCERANVTECTETLTSDIVLQKGSRYQRA